MTFTTVPFWVFLACFFPLYLSTRGQYRKLVLLVASYIFYGSWDVRFLGLLILSTVVDYLVAEQIHKQRQTVGRKRWLMVSLLLNLGLLGYFKYANFFIESMTSLMRGAGVDANVSLLQITLPVGISFYTFQSLSYTIDIYNEKASPAKSLLDFATYVAFFPQLVAGPIERATHILPQIESLPRPNLSSFLGYGLIALGCFKKVIGDHFGTLVDSIYGNLDAMHPLAVWVGTYAFAIQIYLDFGGYSDIAVGVGALMGFEIMQNFRAPYAATGPADFWRRWHISLSTWLRDYLYVPLGGSRFGDRRTARNLWLTMLLGGLWHGAAWNYVLWGVYHGTLLILERFGPAMFRGAGSPFVRRVISFHLVCIGWALFRARSLNDCGVALKKLLNPFAFDVVDWVNAVHLSGDAKRLASFGIVALIVLVLHHLVPTTSKEWVERWAKAPLVLRFGLVAFLLYAATLLSPQESGGFIYFQF